MIERAWTSQPCRHLVEPFPVVRWWEPSHSARHNTNSVVPLTLCRLRHEQSAWEICRRAISSVFSKYVEMFERRPKRRGLVEAGSSVGGS